MNRFWTLMMTLFFITVWSPLVGHAEKSRVAGRVDNPSQVFSSTAPQQSGRSFKFIAHAVQMDFNLHKKEAESSLMQELGKDLCLKNAAHCAFEGKNSQCGKVYKDCQAKK